MVSGSVVDGNIIYKDVYGSLYNILSYYILNALIIIIIIYFSTFGTAHIQ